MPPFKPSSHALEVISLLRDRTSRSEMRRVLTSNPELRSEQSVDRWLDVIWGVDGGDGSLVDSVYSDAHFDLWDTIAHLFCPKARESDAIMIVWGVLGVEFERHGGTTLPLPKEDIVWTVVDLTSRMEHAAILHGVQEWLLRTAESANCAEPRLLDSGFGMCASHAASYLALRDARNQLEKSRSIFHQCVKRFMDGRPASEIDPYDANSVIFPYRERQQWNRTLFEDGLRVSSLIEEMERYAIRDIGDE
jgi:hypothetical protein